MTISSDILKEFLQKGEINQLVQSKIIVLKKENNNI